jgi:hypothetical protein
MSALARTFGIGGFNGVTQGLGSIDFIADKDADMTTFRKELGLEVQDKMATATVNAFAKPADALKAYLDARKEKEAVALKMYKDTGAAYEKAGLPKERAMTEAMRRAKAYLDDELELLGLLHPYASSAEGLISLASGAKRRDILKDEGK